MAKEFDGKAGLVTGAAGGIGRASAVAFAQAGAAVAVVDLESQRDAAEETVKLVRDAGAPGIFIPADVTKAADVEAMVAAAAETLGSLDFAHNNAGVESLGTLDDLAEDDFDRVIAVDLKGVWLCLKYEIKYMKAHGGGSIVNTTSLSGISGPPGMGGYNAAKHGVVGLTRQAATENANLGIRVNAVAPAATATPMMLRCDDDMQQHLMAPQAMHRFADPSEIADVVVFLASPRASFMTGATVPVDGGATASAASYDPQMNPGA